MKNPNLITIESYNNAASAYIEKTPPSYQPSHQPLLNWMEAALSGLPLGSSILEIGSATPRDALYMQSKGYDVQASDATTAFVENLQKSGLNAIELNILTDPIPGNFDLIIANAVAPHFTVEDMHIFIDKIEHNLHTRQRLAFNVKQGSGENWIDEKFNNKRFIHYWKPSDIKDLLLKHQFKIIFFESDIAGDLPTHSWTNIVVEKI